jgi:hypothetical protein
MSALAGGLAGGRGTKEDVTGLLIVFIAACISLVVAIGVFVYGLFARPRPGEELSLPDTYPMFVRRFHASLQCFLGRHRPESWEQHKSKCMEQANCRSCGKTLSRPQHQWHSWEDDTSNPCRQTRACLDCGFKEEREIHTWRTLNFERHRCAVCLREDYHQTSPAPNDTVCSVCGGPTQIAQQ